MHYSIILGSLLLGTFLICAKSLEGRWIPPSAIFMVALYFHGIHAPLIYDAHGGINAANLESVLNYALLAQMASLLGYIVFGLRDRAHTVHSSNKLSMAVLLDNNSYLLAAGIVTILVLYMQVYGFITGGFEVAKGAAAYQLSGDIFFRLATFGLLIPSILLAMLMSIPFHEPRSLQFRQRLLYFIGVCAFFLLTSLMSFERSQIARFLVFCIIYYHFRIKSLSTGNIGALVFILALIQAFAALRIAGTGILNLSPDEFFSIFTSDRNFLEGILVAIPGQEVFAEVIDIVPYTESFKYGVTYFESVVGLFLPRALGLSGYEDIKTPAYWFKEVFASGTVGHGFDFSLLSEAYLNFGEYGIFVVPFIIGGVVFKLSKNIRVSNSSLLVAFCIITLVSIVFSLRSDSNTFFKSIIYLFLPVYLLVQTKAKKRPVNEGHR
jgi:oligosaccharide repeat unit polymerase